MWGGFTSYAKTAHRGSSTAGRGGHRGEAHPHGGHTHLSGTTHAVSHAHASGGGGSHASNAYTTPQKPVQTQGSPHSGTAQPHTQRNRPSVWASSTSQSASQARHHQQQPPPHDSRRFNPSQHNPRGHSSRHGQHQGRPLTGHARSGRTPTQHPHHYSPSAYRNKGHSPMPGTCLVYRSCVPLTRPALLIIKCDRKVIVSCANFLRVLLYQLVLGTGCEEGVDRLPSDSMVTFCTRYPRA